MTQLERRQLAGQQQGQQEYPQGWKDRRKPVSGRESLAAFVRRNRQARGWTQTQLAHKAGISQAFVSGIERGINPRPEPDTMSRLAEVLNIPFPLLMEIAGYMPEIARARAEVVEIHPGVTLVVTARSGERGTPLLVTESVAHLLAALAAVEASALADTEGRGNEGTAGQVSDGVGVDEGAAP